MTDDGERNEGGEERVGEVSCLRLLDPLLSSICRLQD